ncbi:MAG: hypothetical protein FJZ00_08580, partial [Candidatus Sericytochromatia bacterium]|nr:hypothetical protein [Candidatus Tanganyikabacteria bacterium]
MELTSWFRSLMRPARVPAVANIEQEPNPLDRPLVGGSKMPAFWDERSMARHLSPDEAAALAGIPAEHRLAVSWTLFSIRNSEAYLSGQPLRVRVPVSPAERVPYLFKKPRDGVLTVRRLEPPRAPEFALDAKADALVESLTKRWAFVGFKFDGSWKADELMKLHTALLALGPRELAHLRHITFLRGGEHETNAGEYRSHGEKGTVIYYDGTFSHDDDHFVGEGDPHSHGTIFHEIGHALQGWADRELWRQLMAATDDYNGAIERYNAAV